MAFHTPPRTIHTPVRELAIAVAIASVLFLVTRQFPALQFTNSSPSLSINYTAHEHGRTDRPAKQHTGDAPAPPASTLRPESSCLPYIFYDKPVKTGSTAITQALSKYLASKSDPPAACRNIAHCTRVGEDVCAGARHPAHLIHHVSLNDSMAACLRRKGFYHVTSIREPKQRIISAWRFSTTKKENHYGIPYNASFDEFLRLFPRCALYTYYDLLTARCTKEQAERRAEEIANRFDEIIDLTEQPVTDLHRRIQPLLTDVNVAPSGRAKTGELEVPDEVVELEYMLYNTLREKRAALVKSPRRALCER